MERWLPISGFSNYEVSDHGNVRRVRGYQCRSNRLRKAVIYPNGYLHIVFSVDSKKSMRYVHRLVAEAFLGLPADMQVNHKDGNKANNRVENLEVVTQSENMKHSYRVLGNSRPHAIEMVRDSHGRIVRMLTRQRTAA
jgi:hypothetical protein